MLDLRFILENRALVEENTRNRKMSADFDRLEQLARRRSALIQEVEEIRRRQNEIAELFRQKMEAEQRQRLSEEAKELKPKVSVLEAELRELEAGIREEQGKIPNLTHPDAPKGGTDEDNRECRIVGDIPQFDFKPKDHVVLGEELELIDFDAGAKVTGQSFYFLKRDAVLLDFALAQYALRILIEDGFIPHITPDLARPEILEGTGYIPRGAETQIYSLSDQSLCLIATAEITLGGMYSNEIVAEDRLPMKLAGVSHCFRTEAGAHGRASRGLYRVHQFNKVEMFIYCTPEDSDNQHQHMVALEEKLFSGLGIPYRVVDCCTGDLGGPAYRKFDLEAWMPGRGDGGEWGEVTSASNCTDYQSRRLNIRYRPAGGKPRLIHTLNGTAVATSRAIIAVMENYQQKDGSILIPTALQRYMGKERIVAV
ncbi:MAG TPA: serine--tRNA ligase [bacterium]|nr:serine--tRNA ligase [bacterium]